MAPQISSHCVSLGELAHIGSHSGSKGRLAQKVLQHPQHRAALDIRNRIEELIGLGGCRDRTVDRMRSFQSVGRQRAGLAALEIVPDGIVRRKQAHRFH